MNTNLRILMITSEWPTVLAPYRGSYIVRQVEFLRKAGLIIDIVPFIGLKNLRNPTKAWYTVYKGQKRGNYDLVHAQFSQSALPALFPRRIPLVTTFHGSDVLGIVNANGKYSFLGKLVRLMSRAVAYYSDEVIVVAKHLTKLLPKREYNIIPCGIDLELFQPISIETARNRLGLPPKVPIILFGGSPGRGVKQYPLAKASVDIVRRHIPDVIFLTPSGISHDDMPLYYNACDVMLLTSRHEGSPNVVKEALACNVPIVSTDVGDVRERVEGIKGCAICPKHEPDSIALELIKVLRWKQRIDGRSSVLSLDESTLTKQIIAVYNQALA